MSLGSYELISATRFDPFLLTLAWNDDEGGPSPFLLLHYHLNRLVHAAELHGWDQAKSSLAYDKLKSVCQTTVAGYHNQGNTLEALKIRITLSKAGDLTGTASPTPSLTSDPTAASLFNPILHNQPPESSSLLALRIDSKPTPTSRFTSTKTTQRTVYNDARARIGLPVRPCSVPVESDVLLYNPDNLITETSIFNVAFYRSSSWITPAASTGCLPGVFRCWLLEQGRICEAEGRSLAKEHLKENEWVLLFNGVQGCRLGRITCENLKPV